jgi:hypothetical protein
LELNEIKLSILNALPNYKKALNIAFSNNIPSPSLSSSLNYFLSISAGQLTVKGKVYFAISIVSPIGKLLLGKKKYNI